MPKPFNFLCNALLSIPTKFAVLEIFPLNFFNWIVKYSFSNFSLASFSGTERLFSANWSPKFVFFRDSLIIFEILSLVLGCNIAILQPNTKDKISNIIKESLKNTNFGDQLAENSLSVPLKEAREKFEKEYLTIQLKKFNGNISKTANFVGMERSALHRKLKGLGIKEFN